MPCKTDSELDYFGGRTRFLSLNASGASKYGGKCAVGGGLAHFSMSKHHHSFFLLSLHESNAIVLLS